MLAASMGILICTFIDLLLYFIGNSILAPLVALVNTYKITPLLGMEQNSYVPYVLFAFLLIFEVMVIGAYVYVVGRRQISGSEYL